MSECRARNGSADTRDNRGEKARQIQMRRLRDRSNPHDRANSGLFACLRERSANGRLRGGGRSPDRTSLSLQFWEMQGDFAEMQGNATRTSAERPRFSIAYELSSLLKEQGDNY